jgi:DNA-binding transcriptional ArsR family regulator
MDMTERMFDEVALRFACLADASRLRILDHLRRGPANVTAIARATGIGQPSVTKHLAMLRDAGFVDVERVGTQAVYSVADPGLDELCSLMCNGVVRHARIRQARLAELIPARSRR